MKTQVTVWCNRYKKVLKDDQNLLLTEIRKVIWGNIFKHMLKTQRDVEQN